MQRRTCISLAHHQSSLPSSFIGSSTLTLCFSTGGAGELGRGRWPEDLRGCSEGGGMITLALYAAADGDSCVFRKDKQNTLEP